MRFYFTLARLETTDSLFKPSVKTKFRLRCGEPKIHTACGVQSVQLLLKIICDYSVEHSHACNPAISYLTIYPRKFLPIHYKQTRTNMFCCLNRKTWRQISWSSLVGWLSKQLYSQKRTLHSSGNKTLTSHGRKQVTLTNMNLLMSGSHT